MKEQMQKTLENSRLYTMAVAEAMPAGSYDYKLIDSTWNFGDLMNHIAYGIQWWDDNYVKGNKTDWNPPTMNNSKDAVNANLEKAYAGMNKSISNGKLSDDAVHGFFFALDHVTHHRGQAILFLRGKGINPPEYQY